MGGGDQVPEEKHTGGHTKSTSTTGQPAGSHNTLRSSTEPVQSKSATQNYSLSLHWLPTAQRLQIPLCVGHISRAYCETWALWGDGHFKYHTDYIQNIKWALALCKEGCQKILQHGYQAFRLSVKGICNTKIVFQQEGVLRNNLRKMLAFIKEKFNFQNNNKSQSDQLYRCNLQLWFWNFSKCPQKFWFKQLTLLRWPPQTRVYFPLCILGMQKLVFQLISLNLDVVLAFSLLCFFALFLYHSIEIIYM